LKLSALAVSRNKSIDFSGIDPSLAEFRLYKIRLLANQLDIEHLECVPQEFNSKMFARGINRHDVETQLPVADAILHRKCLGSTAHPQLLALIDGVLGRAGGSAAPRLYFDEHQRLAVDCDQIYFRSGSAKIPRDDPVAVALQIFFGGALTAAAERQLCSQPRN
jgi:hypothetical protein